MLNFHIVTLFPEFFDSPLAASLLGRARAAGLVSFTFHNPRDFSDNRHRHVDDRPFGGGAGMVMQLAPLVKTLASIPASGPILQMSPSGSPFRQIDAARLASRQDITIICGRYEGIDARLGEFFPMREISVCEAVLNGGETAAMAIIEATCRLLPDFLGKEESASEESFSNGLLEYPHYTRPENYAGKMVPALLLGGNHARIADWRRQKALEKTLAVRPDLLAQARLSAADAEFLQSLPRWRPGRNLSFCLFHYPVRLDNGLIGTSSLTNLDIHDIARISRSYGMGPFYVLTPVREQLRLLDAILAHWLSGKGSKKADRAHALSLVRPVAGFAQLEEEAEKFHGRAPLYVVTSASWPGGKNPPAPLSPADVLSLSRESPVLICLGTAHGLAMEKLPFECCRLRPLRFLDENHLSVRSAAAILADRILGDFY